VLEPGAALLAFPAVEAEPESRHFEVSLETGCFEGVARVGYSSAELDLDRRTAAELGLRRGAQLELVFDHFPSQPWVALYLDRVHWVLPPREAHFEELYPESIRQKWSERAQEHGQRFAMAEMSSEGGGKMLVYLDPSPKSAAFPDAIDGEMGVRLKVIRGESFHPPRLETPDECKANASLIFPALVRELGGHVEALKCLYSAILLEAAAYRNSRRASGLVDDSIKATETLFRLLAEGPDVSAPVLISTTASKVRMFRILFKKHDSEGEPWVSIFSDLASEEVRLFEKVSLALGSPAIKGD
jgi:hypothetical protein